VDEFALIRSYFSSLTPPVDDVVIGIGDDAALIAPPAGYELAITTDTLVAGRHFPDRTGPFDIGWKALAVNLSDLAAMAAHPRWFTLALTLPEADERWLAGLAEGLGALALQEGIALVGGDTTRGPLSLSITAIGVVPIGLALRRSGACVGDVVCVTGSLGDAALGLRMLADPSPDDCGRAIKSLARGAEAEVDTAFLQSRLNRPNARVGAALALRHCAHAAIDLSDGLAGDLAHILEASGVGADIDMERLPMSPSFARVHRRSERLYLQAGGGDDYELCVCLPPSRLDEAVAALGDLLLTPIGRIVAGPGLRWLDARGQPSEGPRYGYRHF